MDANGFLSEAEYKAAAEAWKASKDTAGSYRP